MGHGQHSPNGGERTVSAMVNSVIPATRRNADMYSAREYLRERECVGCHGKGEGATNAARAPSHRRHVQVHAHKAERDARTHLLPTMMTETSMTGITLLDLNITRVGYVK